MKTSEINHTFRHLLHAGTTRSGRISTHAIPPADEALGPAQSGRRIASGQVTCFNAIPIIKAAPRPLIEPNNERGGPREADELIGKFLPARVHAAPCIYKLRSPIVAGLVPLMRPDITVCRERRETRIGEQKLG